MEPTLAIAVAHLEPIARARIRLQHLAARCERIGLRDAHRACVKAVEAIDAAARASIGAVAAHVWIGEAAQLDDEDGSGLADG
jgi:hypothetical protein